MIKATATGSRPSGLRDGRPRQPRTRKTNPRIGVALAGGGPLGAIYELGALCALEEALPDLSLTDCSGYVGISAGGFLAAGLANGITPRAMCSAFIENDGADRFDPAALLQPAWTEFARRLLRVPALTGRAVLRQLRGGPSLMRLLESLGGMLPTGMLSGDLIDQRLAELFAAPGRSNDFRTLRRQLVLVATDLDSAEAAPFGLPGWDHVPISKAVQASAALPGLFPPVCIDGRHYVDGALKKTVHASVLLDQGLDLLICLNPLVPYAATGSPRAGQGSDQLPIPHMVDGGLPVVMSQAFRAIIHSRLELGMKHYERAYPDTDIVLIEPDQRDSELFLANTFSYRQRRRMAEHAYQRTRTWLLAQQDRLGPLLRRHGLRLDVAALTTSRQLVSVPPEPETARQTRPQGARGLNPAMRQLSRTLDELERALPTVAG